ncbi:MAG: phosphoribosylamine--glycine ligase [Flavobacteriales bacterium]|nr:MAG: phosphoribosylamine--glycine ligase [Flavobacteriales bacterium]
MQYNTLVLGSGGREHAMALMLSRSSMVGNLYVAPGNGGTYNCATTLPDIKPTDTTRIIDAVRKYEIGLVVVGPEDPLVMGLRDELTAVFPNLAIVGPDKYGAQLEGSKDFAKQFMQKYNIPTAAYQSFTGGMEAEAKAFLKTMQPPYVLKADGLAAGKGVLIISDLAEAENAIDDMLQGGKFGAAGNRVVIEEFLDGIEFSVFAAVDGKNYVILPTAKDYKRIGEGDTGLNTGGMGAVSPPPFVDQILMEKVEQRIISPTVEGLKKDGVDYRGFIFFGLINVQGEPMVIEYNCRLGDPETEVVLPRIVSDFGALCLGIHQGNLGDYQLEVTDQTATTVMLVSGGYPEDYKKGYEISGLQQVPHEVVVFHAGTTRHDEKICTSGGRVLAVTSFAANHQQALLSSYKAIEKLCFEDMYFRKDIGFDL